MLLNNSLKQSIYEIDAFLDNYTPRKYCDDCFYELRKQYKKEKEREYRRNKSKRGQNRLSETVGT
jgi:hypothetical protein